MATKPYIAIHVHPTAAEMLRQLSKIEDRSQAAIAFRLIRNELAKYQPQEIDIATITLPAPDLRNDHSAADVATMPH